MLTHLFRITGAIAIFILCTLLPFLPGRYDPLAVPLSLMSQLFGTTGLLLAPIGLLWLVSGYWKRLAQRRFALAIATLFASSVVWVFVLLGAAISAGLSLGLAVLVLMACVFFRVIPQLRSLRAPATGPAPAIAAYLLVVPVAVFLLQLAILEPAIESSRGRAIRNSAQLIADIERYRAAHGKYPASLLSVWPDYSPSVIGIETFHYEPSGDAYNLYFEQFSSHFGTREFVMYNPRDQHVMTSHAMDLLKRTPAELERRRGYYAVHDTPYPHWKYFWFD